MTAADVARRTGADAGRTAGDGSRAGAGPDPRRPRAPQPTLRGYGRFVRRNRAVIGCFTLLGMTVGALLVATSPAEFVAEAKVAVTAQPTGAEIDTDRPRLVSLDSDAQILSSGAVLARAAANAAYPGGGPALRESLDVSALPNSRVLIVRVTDADQALALRACGAIIDEFLRTRAQTEQERGVTRAAALRVQIDDVLRQLGDLRAAEEDGADTGEPAQPDPADPATGLLDRLLRLEDELRLVTSAGAAAPGTIVSPPVAPAASRPMAAATVASGLLIGALIGVAAASLRGDRRDGRGPARRPQPPYSRPASREVAPQEADR